MVAITLTPEDLRQAPAVVRRWLESQLAGRLGITPGNGGAVPTASMLATPTGEEIARLFERIRSDPIATQILLEFGREQPSPAGTPGWLRFRLADLLAYSRVGEPQRLLGYLGAIDRVFQELRGEGGAALFGFDDAGNCYLHETAQRQIREIWHALLQGPAAAGPASAPAAAAPPDAARSALFGAGRPGLA